MADNALSPKRPRMTSVDAFRGLAVLAMVLGNALSRFASTPRPLRHAAPGEMITPADLSPASRAARARSR